MDATLALLLPAGVTWAWSEKPADQRLHPDEAHHTAMMSAARAAEFRQGRQCARNALRRLGLTGAAIPVGFNRAPVWPAGIVGSISHADHIAVAVTARHEVAAGIGIDLETDGQLEAGVVSLICLPRELKQLQEAGLGNGPRLVFAAKESIYKCIWPLLRRFVDFSDLVVDFDQQRGRFNAAAINPALDRRLVAAIQGRFTRCNGRIFALAYLPSAISF